MAIVPPGLAGTFLEWVQARPAVAAVLLLAYEVVLAVTFFGVGLAAKVAAMLQHVFAERIVAWFLRRQSDRHYEMRYRKHHLVRLHYVDQRGLKTILATHLSWTRCSSM